MIYAAGLILMSPQGRVLLIRRGEKQDYPGTWCFPGGVIEDNESAATAACRETLEETNYRPGSAGTELCTRVSEDVHYTTFLTECDEEFVPRLNSESSAWAWVKPSEALEGYPPAVGTSPFIAMPPA